MERIYWDTRSLPTSDFDSGVVWDVRVLYDWRSNLADLVRKVQPTGMGEFLDLDRRATAYLTAAQEGQVDGNISSRKLLPDEIFTRYAQAREAMAAVLLYMKDVPEREEYKKKTYPLLRLVRKIERNGIYVDSNLALKSLKRNDLAVHERAFMKGVMEGVDLDGLIYSKITPVGTRTGRMSVESGFPCMTIPHGVCRQVVKSRFVDGKIVTLDFNAIDYRCLVKAFGDEGLKNFYEGCRDFHSKTASYIHAERDVTKKVTYTHLYGGSKKTLQKQTLLPEAEIDRMLSLLDGLFASISVRRKGLAEYAKHCGFVVTPSGNAVKVTDDDHDGKIIGLFAQSYSSEVFAKALEFVMFHWGGIEGRTPQSKVIFTVHDEIVIDMHPEEKGLMGVIWQGIESSTGFVVKTREGENYAEATD